MSALFTALMEDNTKEELAAMVCDMRLINQAARTYIAEIKRASDVFETSIKEVTGE